jgi:hypothetical protein
VKARRTADYRLYGVVLRSSLRLPCPNAAPDERPSVQLRSTTATRFARIRASIGLLPPRSWFCCRQLTDGHTYLRWTGLFEFLVSADGRQIHYHRLAHATRESFSVYLLGQVLSFPLLALGNEPLHGTVVTIGGKAVAILGDCGYGKSTLAAAMLARGCRVLTDDLIALERTASNWKVHPGLPRLKLFPAVARTLVQTRRGTRMNSGTQKLVLPLTPAESARRPARLAAIYVLSDPETAGAAVGRVSVERLSGREAFFEVVRAAFNLTVLGRERLAAQFTFAARLAADVPVRRLTYPRTLTLLPDVCNTILADLSALANA